MADDQDARNRYSNEDEEYENRNRRRGEAEDEDEEEEDYEEVEEGGKGTLTGFLILFIILFVAAAGLLGYFQFYQPDGSFKLTFQKRQITTAQVKELKQENKQLTQVVDSLKKENQQKQAMVDSMQGSGNSADGSGNASLAGGAEISGTYYLVQIGAFESFSFDRYGDRVTNLTFRNDDGVLKLTLGRFKEANAARAFRRDLAEIGMEDAFIAKMRDGKRLDIVQSF